MSIISSEGGVAYPLGFLTAGSYCGIKKSGGGEAGDLCLIVSDRPAALAACFTKNLFCAAPVIWDKKIDAEGGAARGVVINSGNANAATGKRGEEDCEAAARAFAESLTLGGYGKISAEEILVCSTGVIGEPLPIEKLEGGVKEASSKLGRSPSHNADAAAAIMTTDTFPKTATATARIGSSTVRIGGMAKGSGMIHPDMATLLGFITTDAKIGKAALQTALSAAVEESFNMISVDGDTSTNDTIIALANGAAGNDEIKAGSEEFKRFADALKIITYKLAVECAKDGEGATKLIECRVKGAPSSSDARKAAKAVISSNLFKAAIFGADANFGRALCALGYSGAVFSPENVSLSISRRDDLSYPQLPLFTSGLPAPFSEDEAKRLLEGKEILVEIVIGAGKFSATAWGCDLTYDYVKINGDYRS